MGTAKQEKSPGDVSQKATPREVNYNDAHSVIDALRDEGHVVDIRELQCPDRALVLEAVAKWVRSQPGRESLKQDLLEACLVRSKAEGLIGVDPDAASVLFSALLAEKASVSSLLYPFLIMLQNEDRGGYFQEADLRRRLPEKMGVLPESITEELEDALALLQNRGVLVWYEDGDMYLSYHYIEPTREELKAAGYFAMPTVLRETPQELYEVEVPKGLTPFRYSQRQNDSKD